MIATNCSDTPAHRERNRWLLTLSLAEASTRVDRLALGLPAFLAKDLALKGDPPCTPPKIPYSRHVD
jgi:hypothetical protein